MTGNDAYQYFVLRAQKIAASLKWTPVNWYVILFSIFPFLCVCVCVFLMLLGIFIFFWSCSGFSIQIFVSFTTRTTVGKSYAPIITLEDKDKISRIICLNHNVLFSVLFQGRNFQHIPDKTQPTDHSA